MSRINSWGCRLGLGALTACTLTACAGVDTTWVEGWGTEPSTALNASASAEGDSVPTPVDRTVEPLGEESSLDRSPEFEGDQGLLPNCQVTTGSPIAGSVEVPITAASEVSFTHNLNLDALPTATHWVDLGDNAPIEVVVELVNRQTLRVTPKRALSFSHSYAVSIDEFKSESGETCAAVSRTFSTVTPTFVAPPLDSATALAIGRSGDIVYSTASTLRGLQVHLLGDEQLQLLSEVRLGLPSRGIVVSGDRVYVPGGKEGASVLDISTPESPRLAGKLNLPGGVHDVAAIEHETLRLVAAATLTEGVSLVDVTDLEQPLVLSSLDISGVGKNATTNVDAAGNLLAVGDGAQGLHLVEISNPTAPQLLGSNREAWVHKVKLVGNRLYALYLGWPRVWAFDTADLSTPVAQWNSCGLPCGLNSEAFDIRDNVIRVATGQGGAVRLDIQPDGRLVPAAATLKASAPVMSVLASDDAVLLGESGGVALFSPDGQEPLAFEAGNRGDAHSIAVRGQYAYVAASFSGLQTFDLSDAEQPRQVSRVESPGTQTSHDFAAVHVTLHEDTLILSDGRAGVSFYTLDNPEQPQLLTSFLDGFDRSSALEIKDNTAYACADNSGIQRIDLSDPSAPVRLAPMLFESGSGRACRSLLAHPHEPVLFMGDNRGLGVYDISDGTELVHVTDVAPLHGGSVAALAFDPSSDKLYATTLSAADTKGANSFHLQVVNVDSPTEPVVEWSSSALDAVGPMKVMGQTLFMASGALLSVFDISGQTPQLVGSVAANSHIRGFSATQNAIYLAQSTGGLAVVHTGPLPVEAP